MIVPRHQAGEAGSPVFPAGSQGGGMLRNIAGYFETMPGKSCIAEVVFTPEYPVVKHIMAEQFQ